LLPAIPDTVVGTNGYSATSVSCWAACRGFHESPYGGSVRDGGRCQRRHNDSPAITIIFLDHAIGDSQEQKKNDEVVRAAFVGEWAAAACLKEQPKSRGAMQWRMG
jgi:hypothetical protein